MPYNYLNNSGDSLNTKILMVVVFACVVYVLYNNFYNGEHEYGTRCEYFEEQLVPPYEPMPSECEEDVDFLSSHLSSCRQWYIRNKLGAEFFSDQFSQDTIIDTFFPKGRIIFSVI